MDTLKIKLAITAAYRALDRLEAMTQDNPRALDQVNDLRREIYIIQNELGIVRDLADLKSETDQDAPRPS